MTLKQHNLFIYYLFLVIAASTIHLNAQVLGTKYAWQHRISTTTTHKDSTFTTRWDLVTLWSDAASFYIRVGASSSGIDTTNWSNRDSILVSAGDAVTFGPAIKLRRLEWWASTGTVLVNFLGIKQKSQF